MKYKVTILTGNDFITEIVDEYHINVGSLSYTTLPSGNTGRVFKMEAVIPTKPEYENGEPIE